MAAVEVNGLRKSYGSVPAVDDVSFEIQAGEVFALLGPNGAGKTTTLEILEGFRERDGGEVRVLGYDPAVPATSRALRERMGVVLQELAVEPYLTVRQVMRRNANYYPSPRDVDEVLELVGLSGKASSGVKTLSGGQMRRLDLGLGIVGNPEILYLDEPTTGFDPSARRGAWEVVRELTRTGATVLLTTHYMDEAEALADRVAVISGGRIVASGTPASIGGRDVAEATIRFRLPGHIPVTDVPIPAVETANGWAEIRTGDEVRVLHALTGWALEREVELASITCERLTLEDVYLRLTSSRESLG